VKRVRERFAAMRNTDDYREFIRRCIQWAASIIGSQELVIITSKADEKVVNEVVSELGLRATVNTVDRDLVGVIVRSVDGSISVDATLDSRLNLMEHQIKTLIMRLALTA
nr:V-type ATP synthase subunit E [Vulcanisaeta sp.]